MNQKKANADEELVHKFTDYPPEYRAFTSAADSNITQGTYFPAGVASIINTDLVGLSQK